MAKPDHLVGTTLDRKYLINKVLGEGGMGTVYEGQHMHLNRTCAIKVVRREHAADPVTLKRFKLEAEAASMLKHPNIIEIYDFGITEDELPYIVMEYLPGESLDEILERHKYLHYEQAIPIFLAVCDALAHAHEKSVLHRDLKPPNIMVVKQENGEDLVKLVDFGIAKLLPGTGRSVAKMTQTGEVFGSPLYMSPEQCMGQALDARSDIYALGCVFYETLTGKVPFDGETLFQIIMQHVNDLPRTFCDISPDIAIPEALEDIVLQCMNKERSLRFSSVKAVRNGIAKLYTSKKFKQTAATRDEEPQNKTEKQDKTVKTEIDHGTVKIPQQESAPEDDDDAIDSGVPDNTLEIPSLDIEPTTEEEEKLFYEIHKYETEYGSNCRFLLNPLANLFWLYEDRYELDKAREVKERHAELLKKHTGAESLDYAYALQDLARIHGKLDQYEESAKYLKSLLAIKIKLIDPDSADICMSYIDLAQALLKLDETEEADEIAEKVFKSTYKYYGRLNAETASIEKYLGHYYFARYEYDRAYEHYDNSLQISKELNDGYTKDSREVMAFMVTCRELCDNYEPAIELSNEMIKINRANPSVFDEYNADPYRSIAIAYHRLDRLKEAEVAALEAIKIYQELIDENIYTDTYYISETYKILAEIYKDWGRFDESERCRKQANKFNPN